ncbi:MAG: septal ring lytic transglycosylase RlpA family protein [Bacteroidota bacterium]
MKKYPYIKLVAFIVLSCLVLRATSVSQLAKKTQTLSANNEYSRTLYGQASFYAAKFEGRPTATGEKFSHSNATAACNVLPLGSWVKVTNLRNGKSIVVRTNDRLHPKTKRIIDLTKTGAHKLGYVKMGLTRVKIEVLKGKQK